jgi:hypothetical protein
MDPLYLPMKSFLHVGIVLKIVLISQDMLCHILHQGQQTPLHFFVIILMKNRMVHPLRRVKWGTTIQKNLQPFFIVNFYVLNSSVLY